MANTVGTLNLLQSIVDQGLEIEKFDTAGTSEEYGNPREAVAAPPRLRRRGQPDPPRALADQPEVDLRDREGGRRLPDDELPRRVRPARRRHPDVQQLRASPEPALRHRHDHHAGARARGDRARPARAAARLLLLHRRRARPPDRRRARASRATSTSTGRARTSRWPTGRRRSSRSARRTASGRPAATSSRPRRATGPGASEVMALRVGYEKLNRETGWEPKVSWDEGVLQHDPLVRREPRAVDRPRRLADQKRSAT